MFMGVCNNCWCRGVKGLVRLGMIIIYNAKYLTCNMFFFEMRCIFVSFYVCMVSIGCVHFVIIVYVFFS